MASSDVEKLRGKLSNESIEISKTLMKHSYEIRNLQLRLLMGCQGVQCFANIEENICRCLPYGNINSQVMILGTYPSEEDCKNFMSFSDAYGHYLTFVLSKMGITREQLYFTHLVKCYKKMNEDSICECIHANFMKELYAISPKKIICNGLNVLKICADLKILTGLPELLQYGVVYPAKTMFGKEVAVIAIYNIEKLLQKEGKNYEDCKTSLWNQLCCIFKA